MEPNVFEMSLAGRTLKLERHRFETQAQGSVVISYGDTVLLAAAGIGEKPREGATFFPLSVDYQEYFFAAGKIKGSRFIKRGGRPSEREIITSRLIDRPVRPLFPKGCRNEVQVIVSVLSSDGEIDPGTIGSIGASAALMISGAPFEGPLGSVRMGYVKDESGEEKLVVNPTYAQLEEGRLNLVVAGTKDAITMVEAGANQVSEELILEALEIAHVEIKKICEFQEQFAAAYPATAIEFPVPQPDENIVTAVVDYLTQDMIDSIDGKTKKEIKKTWGAVENGLLEKYASQIESEELSERALKDVLQDKIEKGLRARVLEKDLRLDGRGLTDIRELSSAVGVLPRTHGTGLFQRGETQSLTITTLGGPGDVQIVDNMVEDVKKRYFHHYNFPPYSTGDIKPMRGASRREIGHGDLAERALIPVLPDAADFPYTMWVHSQITSCNGSSSMASVCGSTLSLMDAGVPIKSPVAGIAMGLVTDGTKFKILSDIQGMEDFTGDMDFKVTGTDAGITALQMDIKIKGLPMEVMRDALAQAKVGRAEIMASMLAVLDAPRKELSKFAPLIINLIIAHDKIRDVIGKGGETIQKITGECDVDIDIDGESLKDEGKAVVIITAPDGEKGKKAEQWVKDITADPEIGTEYEGKVVKIMDFGAFVQFMPGKDGLVHISELAHERVEKVEDIVSEGDIIKVKLVKIDDQGRCGLSIKALLPRPERDGGDKPSRD